MKQSIRRLAIAMEAAFAIVALFAGYWSLWRAPGLLAREDNPRRVLAEQHIQRGQILDRNGVILARSTVIDGIASREYLVPGAAPVVGYYSLRYGASGIEDQYDSLLRGDTSGTFWQRLWDGLLHRDPIGGDVRLTLDAEVQQTAATLLAGQQGAIVVIAVPSGKVLAMASAPTYDPNMLEENWDALRDDPSAPLLNRATQGLYQPGASLESIILGVAINSGEAKLNDPAHGSQSETTDGSILPCAANNRVPFTMTEAYLFACPAPFEMLGEILGPITLNAALSDFGLYESPAFALPVDFSEPHLVGTEPSAGQIAIGQGDLTVTPLHMARVVAAFANHGQMPPLTLVSETRIAGMPWQANQPDGTPRGTISPVNADAVSALMAEAVRSGAAQEAALPARSVLGHAGLALTGPDDTLSAWFLGFVPLANGESYVVAVLLEDTPNASNAASLGGQILQAAINSR